MTYYPVRLYLPPLHRKEIEARKFPSPGGVPVGRGGGFRGFTRSGWFTGQSELR